MDMGIIGFPATQFTNISRCAFMYGGAADAVPEPIVDKSGVLLFG